MTKKNKRKISIVELIAFSILFFITSFSIYVVPKIFLCLAPVKYYEPDIRWNKFVKCATEFNIVDIVSIIVVAVFIFLFIILYRGTKIERLKEKLLDFFESYFLISLSAFFLFALFGDILLAIVFAVFLSIILFVVNLIINLIKLSCSFIIFKLIIASVIVYLLYLFLVWREKNKVKLILFILLSLFLILLFSLSCFVVS